MTSANDDFIMVDLVINVPTYAPGSIRDMVCLNSGNVIPENAVRCH